jgi:hypothetical protein
MVTIQIQTKYWGLKKARIKEEQMNEPDTHCENLSKMSDAEKLKLLKSFIMSSLPPMLLLRVLLALVARL